MRRQNLRADRMALLVVVSLALALAGCRGDVEVGATIDPDGRSEVVLLLAMDQAMVTELDAIGIDLTAELEAVAASDPDWEATRRADDGGLQVELRRAVADVGEIGPTLRALGDGLAAEDPQLDLDVDVTRDAEGGVELVGSARFVPPGRAAATLDGEPLGPDAEELAALAAESIEVAFVATLPGTIVDHDADERSDRRLRWVLPVDETVTLRASSQPPSWWATASAALPTAAWVAIAALLLASLIALAVWARRRSGARADA